MNYLVYGVTYTFFKLILMWTCIRNLDNLKVTLDSRQHLYITDFNMGS